MRKMIGVCMGIATSPFVHHIIGSNSSLLLIRYLFFLFRLFLERGLTQVGSVMADDGDSDDEDDQVDDDNVWRCNRDRGAIGGNNDQS